MQDQLLEQIPSLDLADFRSGDPERKAKFVQQLGEAYQNIGFVALKNHGLSDEQTKQLYSDVQSFFQLPDDAKQRYETPSWLASAATSAKARSTPRAATPAT
jgi:isopenicillin N synthase-like dioxygenase